MKNILIKSQRGVVLFVAMIALVVMSLAAAALIRSVDTNTLITGNLSFKQSALVSSDRGIETALAAIKATSVADLNLLNSSQPKGYFAFYDDLAARNLDNPAILRNEDTWNNYSLDGIPGGIEAETQNRIRYIVQRMCRSSVPVVAEAPTKDKCLLGETKSATGSIKGTVKKKRNLKPVLSPIYRVTVRVDGPKNTVSYSQVYVY